MWRLLVSSDIVAVQVDIGLKTDGKRDRFVANATKVVVLVLVLFLVAFSVDKFSIQHFKALRTFVLLMVLQPRNSLCVVSHFLVTRNGTL